jgi:S-adenosylmethionine:tRNA ribosyltransferase-isomerase
MKLSDFDYNLPEELIAQKAKEPRDHSRLLIVEKKS